MAAGDPIVVKFVLDPEEYLRAIRSSHASHSRTVLRILGLLLVVAVLQAIWVKGQKAPGQGWRVGLPVGFLAVGVMYWWNLRVGPKRALDKLGPSKLPMKSLWRFSEEFIECTTQLEDSRLDWKSLVGFKETEAYFFLVPSTGHGSVIPKSGFAVAEDVASFRELLARKTQDASSSS
jgi:hypothetical protein